ncbi:MAG: FliH/SctL family protein, partial [Bdellovibrionaceae bacterium]|nr:FliH/SctL family protein [Pseudobdellovibrionaceae bacterium]MDW8189964.1 FliH/SctL family protein [Pseudobdellovibrionaceae bacterium]
MMLSCKIISQEECATFVLPYELPNLEAQQVTDEIRIVTDNGEEGFQINQFQLQASELGKQLQLKEKEEIEKKVLERLKDIQEEAYQKGFQLGLKDGKVEAYQETLNNLKPQIAVFSQFVQEMKDQLKRLWQQNESHLIDLIFCIGKRLALNFIEERPEIVLQVAQQAVREVSDEQEIILELHPQLIDLFNQLKSQLNWEGIDLSRIVLKSNVDLAPTGCLIKTTHGSVDATFDTRVKNLFDQVKKITPKVT